MRKPRVRKTRPEAAAGAERGPERTRASAGAGDEGAERGGPRDPSLTELLRKLERQAGRLEAGDLLAQIGTLISSGPALAMFAAEIANGLMYYNAVANQQRTNVLGMATTARCVRYMFDIPMGAGEDILEDEILRDDI